jgi:hypothetical protein
MLPEILSVPYSPPQSFRTLRKTSETPTLGRQASSAESEQGNTAIECWLKCFGERYPSRSSGSRRSTEAARIKPTSGLFVATVEATYDCLAASALIGCNGRAKTTGGGSLVGLRLRSFGSSARQFLHGDDISRRRERRAT